MPVRILAAIFAAGVLFPASPASAAKIDITPAISLDQVYDSNVFNTDGNEKGDFIFRATPAVTFSLKMPETTLNLRTSLTSDTYYKYTELNSTNSAITLALDSAPPLRITPRLSIAPSAHFVQARNSYLRTQLVPAADPLTPPSIASETATQKSRDYGAALRANYLLTERTEFSLGGGFSKRQYLDNTTGRCRFPGGQRRHDAQLPIHAALLLGDILQHFEKHVRERDGFPGVRRRSDGGLQVLPGVHGRRPRRRLPHERDLHVRSAGEHGHIAVRRPHLRLYRAGCPRGALRKDRAGRRGKPRIDHPEGNGLPFRERPVRTALVGRSARDSIRSTAPWSRMRPRTFPPRRGPRGSATRRCSGWRFTCPGRGSASRGTVRWERT